MTNERDCIHGHLARSCELCELDAERLENRCLRRAIEAHGLKVLEDEAGFVLSDGTRSPIALVPVDSEKLMQAALQAGRREKRSRERELKAILDRSSIGPSAWINCPIHGHTARSPYRPHLCVECETM